MDYGGRQVKARGAGEVGWEGKEATIMLRMGGEGPPNSTDPTQRVLFLGGRRHLVTGGILLVVGVV